MNHVASGCGHADRRQKAGGFRSSAKGFSAGAGPNSAERTHGFCLPARVLVTPEQFSKPLLNRHFVAHAANHRCKEDMNCWFTLCLLTACRATPCDSNDLGTTEPWTLPDNYMIVRRFRNFSVDFDKSAGNHHCEYTVIFRRQAYRENFIC